MQIPKNRIMFTASAADLPRRFPLILLNSASRRLPLKPRTPLSFSVWLWLKKPLKMPSTKKITPSTGAEPASFWTYRDLFLEYAGIDPFTVSSGELRDLLLTRYDISCEALPSEDLDSWLDLFMTHVIEPRMGTGLIFVRDYPASQAALARLRPGTPTVAARFEVYLNGIELANGFHELADAVEQRERFEKERARRRNDGLADVPVDERLLSALQSGLPDCAGVALGVDRLVMIASGAESLHEVIAFPLDIS